MGNERHFRYSDRFPVQFETEELLNDSFKASVRIMQLDRSEKGIIRELFENKNIKKALDEFSLSKFNLEGDEQINRVNYYVENVIKPELLNIEDRIHLIANNAKIDWTMNEHVEFIEQVGDYLIDHAIELIDDRKKYAQVIKILNKLTSIDKNLLWRSFEELNIKKYQKINEDFREALGFLPNMVYKLRKYNGDDDYIFHYCEGSLAEEFNLDIENINGVCIGDIIPDSLIDKVRMYLDSALYNDIAEFNIVKDDKTLRNVIRAERKNEDGKEFIEIVGYTNDITELNKSEDKIKKLAYYDSMTGLPNRELFFKKLNDLMNEGKPDRLLGIIFVDVDDFKKVNDELGHNAGDQLLIEVANRLKSCVRNGDIVGRYAGDEFTIICTRVKAKDDLKIVVDRIVETVANVPFEITGQMRSITLSMGVAIYPYDETDADKLVENADVAMYKAKNSGKNKYRFYDPTMKSEALTKLQIQNDLRNAFKRSEFHVEYQLQYDSNKSKIVGLEALIRWNHPEKGEIKPNDFIEEAENSGLIVGIGYWVLEESCKRLKILESMGYGDIILGINFSPLQFRQPDLVECVSSILKKTRVNPKMLMIEVTESTSMNNVDKTIEILKELRELGVLISIDDFGTGFSSLSYLKQFPLTNLKIDRSFVSELSAKDGNYQLVKSIIALAQSLELDVIAEGVETQEQYDILKELGCYKFQGYYFSKSVSFEKLCELLETGGFNTNE